ncbi:phage tail protein [Afipia carboxidovorans]|nr:phage tail protein [Afipia carboxidovorans]
MASISARLKARELLEATFEAMIEDGTQAALDLISTNVAPQLSELSTQITSLQGQLEDLLDAGTAPNALQLGGEDPAFYLSLANATGTLPVAKVDGIETSIAAAIDALVAGAPGALDTLKEISDALGNDADFTGTMMAALAARLVKANNLSDLPDVTEARTNLGLKSAATKDAGTASGNVLLLDANGKAASSVLDFASTVEAQAGVNTAKPMNAARVKEAIQALASPPTDRVTQLRLAYAGDKTANDFATSVSEPFSGAAVTGFSATGDGLNNVYSKVRFRYLQYYTPASGWVTSAFA